jgi:hypothetical protein
MNDQVRIEKDQVFTIQTDQEREHDLLESHPEIVTMQEYTSGSNQDDEDGDEDEDKPICMPPSCVPAVKSAPIFIPCDGAEEED